MRKGRVIRFVVAYLALCGIVANLAGIALLVVKPDLVAKVRDKGSEWLSEHIPTVFASEAELAAKVPVDIDRVVPAWQPLPAQGLVPSGKAAIGGKIYKSPSQAASKLKNGETLVIGPGHYKQALYTRANNITILGDGGVHFSDRQTKGKGNMVIAGDNVTIRNIECSRIRVSDGNGACVRQEGKGLILDHVYFHDAQQGLLTGDSPGFVSISDSRFERLGNGGRAHGIYVGGGRLMVENSLFLAGRNQGHEIKSRASDNLIVGNTIASLDGEDSRLIDIPNGGTLTVLNNVLEQGPKSSNGDVIGYALESHHRRHGKGRVVIRNNVIIMERIRFNRLLHTAGTPPSVTFEGNLVISANRPDLLDTGAGNQYAESREAAGISPYPALPTRLSAPTSEPTR